MLSGLKMLGSKFEAAGSDTFSDELAFQDGL